MGKHFTQCPGLVHMPMGMHYVHVRNKYHGYVCKKDADRSSYLSLEPMKCACMSGKLMVMWFASDDFNSKPASYTVN